MSKVKVLVLHHYHPEGYPPALNAINCIADKVKKVTVLSTDTLPTTWSYKKNVKLVLLPAEHNRFKHVQRSKFAKIKSYFDYTLNAYQLIKKEQIDLLVIYDSVPFLFYRLASYFLKVNFKVWYHNHDVYPLSNYKKYGINWLSTKSVLDNFNTIDYFSLPATERKKMYPFEKFKGKFFFIPNYPSKKIINTTPSISKFDENPELKIIYPGSSSHKNGFKELTNIMENKINNKTITLTLVGDVDEEFKTELLAYAEEKNVKSQVRFKARIPYIEMTNYLKKFHIGWALYKPVDLSVATAGSSSNKIYEFLANGLPIIVFDNEHHQKHLKACKAAFFSDLSEQSIISQLKLIDDNLKSLSEIAIKEFELNYQFEYKFNPILDEVLLDLQS
jgi:UDP-N-acetylglucosamine:LPS N-acetylglucosamine transferase